MSTPFSITFLARIVLLLLLVGAGKAKLTESFYNTKCPQFASIVKDAVKLAISNNPRMGASLLRMQFHDCFVTGCDASVLLDDTATFTGEKTAAPNFNSLRGFEVIDNIKAQLETACPGVVSCADILAVAARDGVVELQGPSWKLGLGRRDSTTASFTGAENDLPGPFSDLRDLTSAFSRKGFSPREMVALSGSHTIGQARCFLFRDRIYNEVNTTNPTFAKSLQANCPRTGGDNNLAPLDVATSNVFDNNYYRNLQGQRGLLHSDQALTTSAGTTSQVNGYATNSAAFFNDFAAAMKKMSELNPLTGTQGQIRTNCRRVN